MKREPGRPKKVKEEFTSNIDAPEVIEEEETSKEAYVSEGRIEEIQSVSELQKLGPGEIYYEAPDGFICKGPKNMGSIKDPRGTGMEINPKRDASPRLH